MGRNSRSSSSGSAAVSTEKPASTSSSVSKQNKAIYSSKLVGKQIAILAKEEIENSKKNPVTKEKWLAKLGVSIQKTVSIASYSLFFDESGSLGILVIVVFLVFFFTFLLQPHPRLTRYRP